MKRIVLTIIFALFLIPFLAYSQTVEDFSDETISSNTITTNTGLVISSDLVWSTYSNELAYNGVTMSPPIPYINPGTINNYFEISLNDQNQVLSSISFDLWLNYGGMIDGNGDMGCDCTSYDINNQLIETISKGTNTVAKNFQFTSDSIKKIVCRPTNPESGNYLLIDDISYTTIQSETSTDILLSGTISAESNQIKNVAEPTDTQDAATKSYVDSNVNAFSGSYNDLANKPTFDTPSGLELVIEDGKSGYRLVGADASNYDGIGDNSVDLSFQSGALGLRGASGNNSVAFGNLSSASGAYSIAMGDVAVASSYQATAIGRETLASGSYSFALGYKASSTGGTSFSLGSSVTASGVLATAMGFNTIASDFGSFVIGRYNEAGSSVSISGSATLFDINNTAFVIGNGADNSNRSDAFKVMSNGDTTSSGTILANGFIGDGSQLTNLPAPTVSYTDLVDKPSFSELDGVITTGQASILVGGANSSSNYNTAFGVNALLDIETGIKNTAFGNGALSNVKTGSSNTGIGQSASPAITEGIDNTSVGRKSLWQLTSGSNNVAIGAITAEKITTGDNNTFVGSNSRATTNLTNATAIGANAIVNASNKIKLGNSAVTNLETAGSITAGAITIPNTDGTSGQVLATDGSGTLSWTTPFSGSDSVYNVNTFYAALGGFVIEVRDGGKHGLVVAMQDQGLSTWFPIDNILNDATNHDADGAKFMDWRLPTIRELELIYLAKVNISPMWGGNDYWSSTRPNSSNANFVNMANGFGTSSNSPGANHSTNSSKAVRAVRTF